jgi:hypothetical protein
VLPKKDRIRPIEVGRSPARSRRKEPSASRTTRGEGRNGSELLADRDRTGAGPATAVRRRERLVRVDVHHVEAGLARLEPAQDRVQVGAVHVGEGAGGVDRLQQLTNLRFEQAHRRWVGDHHRRGLGAERGPERLEVGAAVGRGLDRDRPQARHGRGRGVGPVGRVGHEHVGPIRVAPRAVVLADHQDAGQLAVRARRRAGA